MKVEELVTASLLIGSSLHNIQPSDYKDMRKKGKKVDFKLDLDEHDMGFVTVLLRFDIRSLQE